MSKKQINPDMAQDEFIVSFRKKDNKYEVATCAGTNTRDSQHLLMWATIAAEMANTTISENLPKNPFDSLGMLHAAFVKGLSSVVKF